MCSSDLLRAARERAAEAYRLTALRIEEAKEAGTHRQHRMDLAQTILLGALLICLDAMHAFETKLPLPERFQWPLITLLMALAFALPPLFIHWRDRYGALEYAGAILLAGSFSWLFWIVSETWPVFAEYPLLFQIGPAALFLAFFVGAVYWRSRAQTG